MDAEGTILKECNGLINQDTSKDRFIMSLEVKYEQSNQTKKT